VLATQNPIEMEGTSALPEAPLRLVPAQAARAVSGDRGAGRKHFQFQLNRELCRRTKPRQPHAGVGRVGRARRYSITWSAC